MPPPGLRFFHSRNMAFHCIRLPSTMPWPCNMDGLPQNSHQSVTACDSNFTVERALSCAKGGFPSIRHNEIRDLTANLLTEVCNEVCIKLNLQPTHRGYSKWSIRPSLHLFFWPQEEWGERQPVSTNVWLPCSLRSGISHTVPHSAG